ncbi:MAG TPA: HlyD family secretion protein [Rhizomicrobium sp.]|jgi:membrane fusion protein (multidrug efflux system)
MTTMQTDTTAGYGEAGPAPGWLPATWDRLRTDRGFLRRVLMYGGVVIVLSVALGAYLMGGRYVSTDDSYIQSAKLMVSTDVSGLVKTVNVKEGQTVKKGDVLFTLDPQPFRIALQNAQSMLAQTVQTVASTKSDYQQMIATVAAQRAQVDLDQRNYVRYAALLKANAIAPATYDQARLTLATAQQQLAAAQQTADSELAKLNGDPNIAPEKTPQYQQALAQVNEMQRQLDHSVVRAPFSGIVSEVDSLQPGTLVISAMSSFSTTSAVGLVSTENVWVEAQMKETDLTNIRLGAPVDVEIDTYPGRVWHGTVEAISAATSSAFSVLPAENASGNWVKVQQRIPLKVRIHVQPGDPELRSGMSAEVSVDTGHRRWWRMLNGG